MDILTYDEVLQTIKENNLQDLTENQLKNHPESNINAFYYIKDGIVKRESVWSSRYKYFIENIIRNRITVFEPMNKSKNKIMKFSECIFSTRTVRYINLRDELQVLYNKKPFELNQIKECHEELFI